MEAPQRGGLVRRRLGNAAFGDDNLHGVEHALILDNRRIDHGDHLGHHIGPGIGKSVPHANQRLAIIGAGEIDGEVIARNRAGDMHLDIRRANRVSINQHRRLISTIGPCGEFGFHPRFGVVNRMVDRCLDFVRAVAGDQRLQPQRRLLHPADHRREITGDSGKAVVADNHVKHIASRFAAMHQLDAGELHPFGEHVGRLQRKAARVLAAGIALMGLQRDKQDQLAAGIIDWRVNAVIRQVPAAVIGIVRQQHIARTDLIFLHIHQRPAHHHLVDESQLRRANRAHRQPPVGIDDGGITFI